MTVLMSWMLLLCCLGCVYFLVRGMSFYEVALVTTSSWATLVSSKPVLEKEIVSDRENGIYIRIDDIDHVKDDHHAHTIPMRDRDDRH